MQSTKTSLDDAYSYCRSVAASHYENFPVASWLLPKRLRNPIAAIYCFARVADDFADEGVLPAEQRLQELDKMAAKLNDAIAGTPSEQDMYIALADTIKAYALPGQLFHDLLDAFRQDVTKKRYANFSELLAYCQLSANPVGRLLLHLFGRSGPENCSYSDSICSSLQLINFLQDVKQDYEENGRIYIPSDEMKSFIVSETDIAKGSVTDSTRELFAFQIQRADEMLRSGATLGRALPGLQGLEIRMIVLGGLGVLNRLRDADNPFARPRLGRFDRLWMAINAILCRIPA